MATYKTGNYVVDSNASLISLFAYTGNMATPHSGMFPMGKDSTSGTTNAYSAGSGTAFWVTTIRVMTTASSGAAAIAIGYNTSAISVRTSTAPAGTDTTVIGDVNGAFTSAGKNGFVATMRTSTSGPWRPPQQIYQGPPFELIPSSAGVVYPYLSVYNAVGVDWTYFIEGYEV